MHVNSDMVMSQQGVEWNNRQIRKGIHSIVAEFVRIGCAKANSHEFDYLGAPEIGSAHQERRAQIRVANPARATRAPPMSQPLPVAVVSSLETAGAGAGSGFFVSGGEGGLVGALGAGRGTDAGAGGLGDFAAGAVGRGGAGVFAGALGGTEVNGCFDLVSFAGGRGVCCALLGGALGSTFSTAGLGGVLLGAGGSVTSSFLTAGVPPADDPLVSTFSEMIWDGPEIGTGGSESPCGGLGASMRGAAGLGTRETGVAGPTPEPRPASEVRDTGVLPLPEPLGPLRPPGHNGGISSSGGGPMAVCVQGNKASATSIGV